MADRYTEARLENWARANRECHRATKGATQVFCESLRYLYGMPETEDGQPVTPARREELRTIDLKDADKLDKAYRSPDLLRVHKALLRMFYISHVSPKFIEKRLSLGYRTFFIHKERAIRDLMKIVIRNEQDEERRVKLT